MKIWFDDMVSVELKDYLLSQDGILDVNLNYDDFIIEVNIDFDDKTSPEIIIKYIDLFLNNNYFNMVAFEKKKDNETKILKYRVDDMCCEYCYKGLVRDLFNNKHILSVSSNFDFIKPAFDIDFVIEYSKDYSSEELIKYIKDQYN